MKKIVRGSSLVAFSTLGLCLNLLGGETFAQGVGTPLPSAPPTSPIPVLTYEYDANGNPTRTIRAPGVAGFAFATVNTYDTLGRRKDTTDAKTGVTRFTYDGQDRTTQITDPRNLSTQTPRNGLGDVTKQISPDTGTTTRTYDAAGNLKTQTDSRGVVATFTYDGLRRVTGLSFAQTGQTTQAFSWTYNQTGAGFAYGIGRLTSTGHPNGSGQYTYTAEGELATDIQRINPAAGANSAQIVRTTTYGYDTSGHLTSIVYPSGRKLTVTYTAGQATALSLAKDGTSAATPLISQIQYVPFGPPSHWLWQMTSGTQSNDRVYDSSGRLVRYRLGGFIRDLTYDAANRITSYKHYDAAFNSTVTSGTLLADQTFSYDALGRLTNIAANSSTWTIAYDANGNRTSVILNGATSAYATPATSNRLASITNPARSFTYDNAGNVSQESQYTATYNVANRLASLTKAGVTTTYTYNERGQRVRKSNSAGTTIFVYDKAGQLLGEYDQSGTALREYVWLGTTPVAVFTPDPANAANPPLIYYVHADHLDAPRIVVDKANNIRWRWRNIEPFGNGAAETNPNNLGNFTLNLRFPGQYADSESGLFYNYWRYYDSSIGRYSESDPIGLAGGINTYAYVNGGPVNYIDPQGKNLGVAIGVGLTLYGLYKFWDAVSTAGDAAQKAQQANQDAQKQLDNLMQGKPTDQSVIDRANDANRNLIDKSENITKNLPPGTSLTPPTGQWNNARKSFCP